ncbi:MAG: S9 family peptidase [Muribaculaceae bacterium]|nr:S9 family peptidase [Muribaculaceae bacterium]
MSYILKSLAMMTTALMAASCSSPGSGAGGDKLIDKPEFTPEGGQYTIDALEAFGKVSDPVISPDKTKILYGVSYESVEENKSNLDLYVMNLDGTDNQRITRTPSSENGAVWIDGGKKIAYMAPVDGVSQLWVMNADGSGAKAVSSVESGISGFLFSPDEKQVLMIGSVKYSRTAQDVYPDLPKATGRLIDDLMYKHWDEWVTEIPHPLLGAFDGSAVTDVIDIMQDEPFEAPMKPFGGIESFAWAPDSRSLIYVSRKKTGMEYALSTNSDLYLYDVEAKSTKNITEGMMGYDTCPAYSPDGKYVAWLSMEHDGYESDKNRIFIMDMASGEKTDLTADWDYTADAIAWNPDGKSIYFIAAKDGVTPIFSVALADRKVDVVADGQFDYASLAPVDGSTLITMRHSMVQPNELISVAGGKAAQISHVNTELLAQLDMPKVEKRMVPTTDGKLMTTWVLYPPKFDPNKKYPAILYCQGGPQSAVSQFWSTRWNLALMAANGYIVIAPNRRGLPGFGTEWNAQISKDYGGQNMKDYFSAVDDMKKEPYIDADRIGAVGASYGGFSVYWLAGHHEGRFAAFIAHAGIFNTEAQYLETEEMWFANWDMGGPFWDKTNAAAQGTFATSPHRFVDKWDTPILITHGEYDFRILASQGMQAFNAARLRGVPAEMLIFPDENHWILKPQNAVMWQRIFFRWLDRWLKPDSEAAKAAAQAEPTDSVE